MPKAAKSRGSGKDSQQNPAHNQSKPYRRTKSAADPTPSTHAESSKAARTNSMPGPSTHTLDAHDDTATGRKTKRRRRKSRHQAAGGDGAAQDLKGGDVNGNDAFDAPVEPVQPEELVVVDDAPSPKQDQSYIDNLDQIRRRVFGTDATTKAKEEVDDDDDEEANLPSSASSRKDRYKTEARALRRRVQEMENTANELLGDLNKRIDALETTVATQRTEMHQQAAELEIKTKLISDQGNHSDAIREHLLCGVCFEAFDDPHILSCGHCACRKCLLDWFRSPNAYPAPDVETVGPEDDMTYRTKVCHMCRERLFRRPTRMFVMQHMVDVVGLTRGLPANQQLVERGIDPWINIFPPEPKAWLVRDDDDHVNRCPRCGAEVDFGECHHCGAVFSHAGSDMSDEEVAERYARHAERIDLGNGLLMDDVRGIDDDDEDDRNSFIDDEAEDDLDGMPRLPDDPLGVEAFRNRVDDYLYRHRQLMEADGYHQRMLNMIDNIAANVDGDDPSEYDSDYDGMDDDFDRLPSPPPYPGSPDSHYRENAYHYRGMGDLGSDEGGYESSFIDDDEDEDNYGSDRQAASVDAGGASEDEVDEPNLDELRQRRAARYAAPRSPSVEIIEEQPRRPRRRTRTVIEISDSDDD